MPKDQSPAAFAKNLAMAYTAPKKTAKPQVLTLAHQNPRATVSNEAANNYLNTLGLAPTVPTESVNYRNYDQPSYTPPSYDTPTYSDKPPASTLEPFGEVSGGARMTQPQNQNKQGSGALDFLKTLIPLVSLFL